MGQLQDMDTIVDFLKLNKEDNKTLTILCGHGKKYQKLKIQLNSIISQMSKFINF